MTTVHYSTKAWKEDFGGCLSATSRDSLEEAKKALPNDCMFAVIFAEDGAHTFSPIFKWRAPDSV